MIRRYGWKIPPGTWVPLVSTTGRSHQCSCSPAHLELILGAQVEDLSSTQTLLPRQLVNDLFSPGPPTPLTFSSSWTTSPFWKIPWTSPACPPAISHLAVELRSASLCHYSPGSSPSKPSSSWLPVNNISHTHPSYESFTHHLGIGKLLNGRTVSVVGLECVWVQFCYRSVAAVTVHQFWCTYECRCFSSQKNHICIVDP